MVEILDTTLREGEQTPGVTFSINEKIEIANLLDRFGVNIIEAGHPSVSKDVFAGIKELARQGYDAEILAHTRAIKEDIDLALSCDVDWIGIFLCMDENRLTKQFNINLDEAVKKVTRCVEYAKDNGLKVRFTPEDTIRTDFSSIKKIIKSIEQVDVDRISIADTVGISTPFYMYNFVKKIKSTTNIKLNVHCHNDLGLATANSLAAFEAGVSMIDVSVNGLGERVGIAPLSEVCMILKHLYDVQNDWKLDMIPKISKKVEDFSGLKLTKNSPIVGENAFKHKAGLHVTAVLKDPIFYEPFPAELVGRKREFTLDKMAGKQSVRKKIENLGLSGCKDEGKILEYAKSKDKGEVSDNEIFQILGYNKTGNYVL